MAEYGIFPGKIEIFRGCDARIFLQMLDKKTKEPIDYTGSTFSAIIIDQQASDYTILATFSEGTFTSISTVTATLEFKLSNTITASLTNDQSYLRIYRFVNGEKYPWALGEIEVKD